MMQLSRSSILEVHLVRTAGPYIMALLGPREMSDLSQQSGPKRTFDQAALIFDLLDNPLPTTGATKLSSARRCLVEKLFE